MVNEQLAFLSNYPKGIYRMHFLSNLTDELRLDSDDRAEIEEKLIRFYSRGDVYIQTPEEFLQRWLNGRSGKTLRLPSLDGVCQGFELQIPHVMVDTFKIDGLAIASDFGYTGDFRDNVVFAVNDIPSQRVLTYHDRHGEEIKKSPSGIKPLVHKPIYDWGEPNQFPFESLNPGKSLDYTWSMINITPEEVYDALKRVGFRWQ